MLSRLRIPIIQAPMLGATDATIAIAVSKVGGLGSFAAAGSTPQQIHEACAQIRAATDAPFAVNAFVLEPADPDAESVRAAMELLAPWRARFGLPEQAVPNQWAPDTRAQLAAIIEAAPPVASFTFGCLTRTDTAAMKERGTFIIGTATTVAEAKAWADVGADAICAQGIEAGGHRGTFLADMRASSIGVISLVRTICEAIELPVIAAGGLTDGESIAAALMLGADAVQVGTAYLLADEAITPAPHRRAIEEAGDDPTALTRVISGRTARGIDNAFMREMQQHEDRIPPYPVQNALTAELRAAATKAGNPDAMSLWAGQSVQLAQAGSAATITERLWRDAQAMMRARTTRYAASPLSRGGGPRRAAASSYRAARPFSGPSPHE
jgi:nitronate monooxygenase